MEEIIKELQEEYLDLDAISRDFMGRYLPSYETVSSVTVEGVRVGWYQDGKGSLHHYDGVVWDSVPNGQIEELEFLGL